MGGGRPGKIRGRSISGSSISGLVVEYIVAIDVTRVRFPADALFVALVLASLKFALFRSMRYIFGNHGEAKCADKHGKATRRPAPHPAS